MDEHHLRESIEQVRIGPLDRRRFVQAMVGLGLTAPMVAQMLASAGIAQAQPRSPAFVPTRRGGGGELRVLWWQAPTLLNPHFANGTKDQDAARVFYEPLAGYDPDGNIVPSLATEVPSVDNGVLAKDGTCSRRASTTVPGTCRWRTTSSAGSSRAARAA
jgi:peptide/nickel transport system substrate-binding protein